MVAEEGCEVPEEAPGPGAFVYLGKSDIYRASLFQEGAFEIQGVTEGIADGVEIGAFRIYLLCDRRWLWLQDGGGNGMIMACLATRGVI